MDPGEEGREQGCAMDKKVQSREGGSGRQQIWGSLGSYRAAPETAAGAEGSEVEEAAPGMGSQQLQTRLSPLLWSHIQTWFCISKLVVALLKELRLRAPYEKWQMACTVCFPVILDSTRILGKQSFLASTSCNLLLLFLFVSD